MLVSTESSSALFIERGKANVENHGPLAKASNLDAYSGIVNVEFRHGVHPILTFGLIVADH